MQYKLIRLGGQFCVEGEDLKEIIKQSSLIMQIPEKCSLCEGDVRFDYRCPKGYDYYSLRCVKCGASKNFGQSKEDNALFLKWDEKFEKYQPKQQDGAPDQTVPEKEYTKEDAEKGLAE